MAVSFSRLIKIDRMIRQGTFRSAGKAAEEFEVSRRTIERDLEELRFRIGADLEYNRKKGTYEYAGNPQPLNFQGHTPQELAIVLLGERALRLFTGMPFDKEIHSAFNKLLAGAAEDKKYIEQVRGLCSSIHFYQPFTLSRDISADFGVILEATMTTRRLEITYWKPGSDVRERRRIDPFLLVNDGWAWYVVAGCCKDHKIKQFTLDRVFNPVILDHYFSVPSSFKPEEYFRSGFGKIHGIRETEVQIRMTGKLMHWIETHMVHRTQKLKTMDDGSVVLTMNCGINDYLVGWILGMGRNATVIRPQELKQRIMDEAKGIFEQTGKVS